MNETLRSEADSLDEAAERLADLSIELLSRGVKGDQESVRVERELQRARRSIVKASQILRSISGESRD